MMVSVLCSVCMFLGVGIVLIVWLSVMVSDCDGVVFVVVGVMYIFVSSGLISGCSYVLL